MDGTFKENGIYNDRLQDTNFWIRCGINVRMDTLLGGMIERNYLNNPHQRFNEQIEDYNQSLEDFDDISFGTYDNFERMKPFQPKEGTTVGEGHVVPVQDTDTKLNFYDV